MRSHARRNRERILEVARGAFAGSDRDISLNEVARQAEVGIGTLFRHFPNRDALLEALPHDRTAALLDEVDRLLDAPDAGAALFGWLDKLIAHIATYRGGGRQAAHHGARRGDGAARVLLLPRAGDAGIPRPGPAGRRRPVGRAGRGGDLSRDRHRLDPGTGAGAGGPRSTPALDHDRWPAGSVPADDR
nr:MULTISPECIES: helix-turn-helix domain-containing protein [unclassified Frankia]